MLEALQQLVYLNPACTWAFFLASYFVIGFLLKYVDEAFDDNMYSKKKAFIVGLVLAFVGALGMVLSPTTMVVFTGLIIGLIIARKVDNPAFIAATFVLYFFFFALGGTVQPLIAQQSEQAIFLLFFLAAMVEEKIDYKKAKLFKNKRGKTFSFIFEYGVMLKLCAFLVFIVIKFDPLFFFAVLLFDLGYDLMVFLTHKRLGKGILWA